MRGARSLIILGVLFAVCLVFGLIAVTALALPAGRHYEMVSPPYKEGYGIETIEDVAAAGTTEGDRVEFGSDGTFAGAANNQTLNSYLAERTSTGWVTVALAVPSTRSLPREEAAVDVSPSMTSVLFLGLPGSYASMTSRRSLEPHEMDYLVQRLNGFNAPFELVGAKPLARLDGGALEVAVFGTSADMCHILFYVGFAGADERNEALLEEGRDTLSTLYELSAGNSVLNCGSEMPSLRLVGVGNENGPHHEPKPINPDCLTHLGGSSISRFNAVSAGGAEILFTDSQHTGEVCDEGPGPAYKPKNPAVLYARLGGERTVRISTPIEADCKQGAPCYKAIEKGAEEKDAEEYQGQQTAEFAGASADGTRVFFTTVQPLATGDNEVACQERVGGIGEFVGQEDCETGGQQTAMGKWKRFGNDLYMAKLECPGGGVSCPAMEREVTSLVQASRPPGGGSGEVVGEPLAVSMHGERVYFVAHGVLTAGPNREGRVPVEGAENLYVYDVAEDQARFIAELCSGFESSGEAVDRECPQGERSDRGLWHEGVAGENESQTTGQTVAGASDGRYLVFTSYGRLVPSDTDTGKDLYRYDAQTESLVRVSVGEDGASQNGNAEGYNVDIQGFAPGGRTEEEYELGYRTISEDGSRIVFGTAEPLSPGATSGFASAYEWYDGKVSLIATSLGEAGVGSHANPAIITPSGNDVFFMTTEGLAVQDADGVSDVYDARTGEGFPPKPVPRNECENTCNEPLATPAPLLVPGSVAQAPGERVVSTVKQQKTVKKKRHKGKRQTKSKRGRLRAKHTRYGHGAKGRRGRRGR